MANEWRTTTLGQVIELKRGYDLPTKSRRSGPYPIVSSSGPTDTHSEFKARAPGVVTGRYGTIGEVYYITTDYWPLNTALYVKDFKGNYPRFVSYFLRGIDFVAYSDKSAIPGVNRNHLHQATVKVPSLGIQKRIADILGKLDDKIELNRRMNRTLEKMAAAIFKSWFIDFDPVHAKAEGREPNLPAEIADLFPGSFEESELGAIPKGWDVKPLDEIADYLNGLACQKHPPVEGKKSLPVIKIRELRQGITNNTDRASADVPVKYIVEDGDVLFSWSGSLLVSIWCGGRGVLNQHVFKVTSERFPKWYFYQATKHHLDEFQHIASDKATTMGHIKRHHLNDAKMAIPGEELMAKGTEVLGTMLDGRINALRQARILALTRDALLPKLLSGDIEIPEAEELVKGVT